MARVSLTVQNDLLKEEVDVLAIGMQDVNKGIIDLSEYLLSEKFYNDTTVQVSDILHRLQEIRSNIVIV